MNIAHTTEIEALALETAQEMIQRPNALHEKKDLPDPIKGFTASVRNTLRKHFYPAHEVLLAIEYPLTTDLHDLPQMVLLQFYRALSNPSLQLYVPEKFFKRVEAICRRIYYSVTYNYTQSQINALEQAINAGKSQGDSAGISVDGSLSLLKAVLEWRHSISSSSNVTFSKRFQNTFTTARTSAQKEMSASEATSILDSMLERLGKQQLVFCYHPLLDADELIREKLANQTVLDKAWAWWRESLLGDLTALVLYLPWLVVKTAFNLLQFVVLFLPFDKLLGKKKFKMLFIFNGFDPQNPDSEKAKSQMKSLLHNPNTMVLLTHKVGG